MKPHDSVNVPTMKWKLMILYDFQNIENITLDSLKRTQPETNTQHSQEKTNLNIKRNIHRKQPNLKIKRNIHRRIPKLKFTGFPHLDRWPSATPNPKLQPKNLSQGPICRANQGQWPKRSQGSDGCRASRASQQA